MAVTLDLTTISETRFSKPGSFLGCHSRHHPSIRELADGRIYSAQQAKKNGLIDEIGYLEGTIQSIQKRLGAQEVRVVNYSRKRNPPSNIYARTSVTAPIEIEPDVTARVLPRAGFYYLWWPASP